MAPSWEIANYFMYFNLFSLFEHIHDMVKQQNATIGLVKY